MFPSDKDIERFYLRCEEVRLEFRTIARSFQEEHECNIGKLILLLNKSGKVGQPKTEWWPTILNKRENVPETAQPPPISATRLLPCAWPDKVALIKICYFFQKMPFMPLTPLCSMCNQKFPYLMEKLISPIAVSWGVKKRQLLGSVCSIITR